MRSFHVMFLPRLANGVLINQESSPLNPIWHGLFLNRQSWWGGEHEGPHHNVVVIAPMIMQFGTGVKLDVFYTMVTKKFVTSLLLRHYDVITCILADA